MIRNLVKSQLFVNSNKYLVQQSKGRFITNTVSLMNENSVTVAQKRDAKDIQKLADEETQVLRESTRLYFLPWVNNHKVVYESQIPADSSSNYTLLGGILGAGFLYMLWEGDFKYKYFLGVPLLAALALRRAKMAQLRNRPGFIKEISLNKSGQTVNLVVSQSGRLSNLESVSIADIKQVYSPEGTDYSKLRHGGYGNNGYQVQVGNDIYVAPYNYVGNEFALQNIWKGSNVDTSSI